MKDGGASSHLRVELAFALVTVFAACAMPEAGTGPAADSAMAPPTGQSGGRMSVAQAMAPATIDGFARATEPRDFVFPADHGPHPEFQTEWWYLTGHLRLASGRKGPEEARDRTTRTIEISSRPSRPATRFGYQLTFFRSALGPPGATDPPEGTSHWRSRQVFMAHFAITDVEKERYLPFERFSRGALGLAGARAEPFRVWLDDWSLEAAEGSGLFPLRARAASGSRDRAEEVGLDLVLEQGRTPLLHGDAGLSRKGSVPGNASYYYSLTRLPTRGRVRLDGREIEVEGTTWLDREWSTSALEPGVVGWDWLALELSDGTDVMVYRLRRSDGSASRFSSGTVAFAGGERLTLTSDAVQLSTESAWRSPRTGVTYPSTWSLSVAAAELDLRVVPLVAAQEHAATFAYWEGAASVEGTRAGLPVSGTAYVELTGYESDP